MLVAIDAGHGHNTPGKRTPDDSMREHDFNGNVATKVCNILEKNGLETYRSDDITGNTDVPLITRTNNINSKKANICVSIHANAYTGEWNDANGIETYIIARGGEAEKIANIVQRKLIENTGRKDRGVKISNLHMCRETNMPAILCECGFMDNREEAELLKSEEYRIKCAEAIAYGILEYLNIIPTGEEENTVEIKYEGSDEPVRKYVNGSTPEESEIKAMVVGNNMLWVFKEPNQQNETIFYHTSTLEQEGKVYPSYQGNVSTGCYADAINYKDDIVS